MVYSRIHPDDHHRRGRRDEDQDIKNVKASSFCDEVQVLTVWNRSSMSFQGTDGFTVFDGSGRLAFRVDNYTRMGRWRCANTYSAGSGGGGGGGGLLLMDGSGKALFTLKPQVLSMQYQWNGYRGEGHRTSSKSREFTMRRPSSPLMINSSSRTKHYEAEIFMGGGEKGRSDNKKTESHPTPDFEVEGSFRRRNCKIKSSGGALVATITRKRVINTTTTASTILLTDDVFSLVVQPGFDPQLIMAFVIVLDRICPKPFAPLLCS